MKISHFKDPGTRRDCFMISVTQQEALELIESLTHQIRTWDPNSLRTETVNAEYTPPASKTRGAYASIAVMPYPVRMPSGHRIRLRETLDRLVAGESIGTVDLEILIAGMPWTPELPRKRASKAKRKK